MLSPGKPLREAPVPILPGRDVFGTPGALVPLVLSSERGAGVIGGVTWTGATMTGRLCRACALAPGSVRQMSAAIDRFSFDAMGFSLTWQVLDPFRAGPPSLRQLVGFFRIVRLILTFLLGVHARGSAARHGPI